MVKEKKFNLSKAIKSIKKDNDEVFPDLVRLSKEYPMKFIPYINTLFDQLSKPNPKKQRNIILILINLAARISNSLLPYLNILIGLLEIPNDIIRVNALLVLEKLSKIHPEVLANHFESISALVVDPEVEIRRSALKIHRYIVTKAPHKITPILDKLEPLFEDEDRIVRDHTVMLFSKIEKISVNEIKPYLRPILKAVDKTSGHVQKRIFWIATNLIKKHPEAISKDLDVLFDKILENPELEEGGLKFIEIVSYQLPDKVLPYIDKMWENIDKKLSIHEYGAIISIVLINYPGTLAKYIERLSDLFSSEIETIITRFRTVKDEERLKEVIILAIVELYHPDLISNYKLELDAALEEYNYVKKNIEKVKELKGLNVPVPKELVKPEVSEVSTVGKLEKKEDRIPTGVKELDYLLYGGLPENYLVALRASSCDERDLLINKLIKKSLSKDMLVIYVTSTLAKDLESYYTIYCSSDKSNVPKEDMIVACDEGVTSINLAIARILMKEKKDSKKLIILENLSKLLVMDKPNVILNFLKSLSSKMKNKDGTILGLVNPGMHPPEVVAQVLDSFDCDIEIFEESHENIIERFIRINKLVGKDYKDEVLKIDKSKLLE